MKSINFQRKDSVLRVLEEDKRKKRSVNWDRIVYFIIIGVIAFFLFRYMFTALVYIEGDGQVLFENVSIRVPDDITIHDFYCGEGDSVKEGDTLFVYTPATDDDGGNGGIDAGIAMGGTKSPEWIEKELYNLNKTYSLNNLQISENKQQIAQFEKEIERIKNEVILDVTPKSSLDFYERQIESMQFEIISLQKENQLLLEYINKLKNRDFSVDQSNIVIESTSGYTGGGSSGGTKYYYSPIEGTITRIHMQPHEVALKSEVILNIHKPENIYIKAFFEQEDLKSLKQGDIVNLEFPDGTDSQGIVKRFYFATYVLPEEFQQKYEPTQRSIAADIYPINEQELEKWKAFYKMSVIVTKPKI